MPICIYCENEKSETDMTLEHTIPRCLGGAYAPDVFKTRRVCKTCNSNLGQFVDAGFEKSFFVSNWLQMSAFDCFDPQKPTPIPLVCFGFADIRLPGMEDDEVCECYIGPLGEVVLWVRPHDENFYWYMGGNPQTAKTTRTRAYFTINERTVKNQHVTWMSFRSAFRGKKVKKVLCAETAGATHAELGFSEIDQIDKMRIEYIREHDNALRNMKMRHSTYLDFDTRFMAKLARGIGFAMFGNKVFSGTYAGEISKAIWLRPGDPDPGMLGAGFFTQMGKAPLDLMAHKNAVVISLINLGDSVALDLRIGRNGATVMCIEGGMLTEADRERLGYGQVVLLFKFLKKAVVMSLPNYIQHFNGATRHQELSAIDDAIERNNGYFKNL